MHISVFDVGDASGNPIRPPSTVMMFNILVFPSRSVHLDSGGSAAEVASREAVSERRKG